MTETAAKPISFTAAAKRYFFPKEAKASEVLKELNQLTEADKTEMAPLLAVELGCEVTYTPKATASA